MDPLVAPCVAVVQPLRPVRLCDPVNCSVFSFQGCGPRGRRLGHDGVAEERTGRQCARLPSVNIPQSLLKLRSTEAVMPSNHPAVPCSSCPQSPRRTGVFSESALRSGGQKSFSSASVLPGLVSFRTDWMDLLAVQGTLKSLLQHHSSKASILRCSLDEGPKQSNSCTQNRERGLLGRQAEGHGASLTGQSLAQEEQTPGAGQRGGLHRDENVPRTGHVQGLKWPTSPSAHLTVLYTHSRASLLPTQETPETQVRALGGEDPLEEEMATQSSVLAVKIPWTEEPAGLHAVHEAAESQTRRSTHTVTRIAKGLPPPAMLGERTRRASSLTAPRQSQPKEARNKGRSQRERNKECRVLLIPGI